MPSFSPTFFPSSRVPFFPSSFLGVVWSLTELSVDSTELPPFDYVSIGFRVVSKLDLPGFVGSYSYHCSLPGFLGCSHVLLGFTGFLCLLLIFTVFFCVLLVFSGF